MFRFLKANRNVNEVQKELNGHYVKVRGAFASSTAARIHVVQNFHEQISAPYKLLKNIHKQTELLESLSILLNSLHPMLSPLGMEKDILSKQLKSAHRLYKELKRIHKEIEIESNHTDLFNLIQTVTRKISSDIEDIKTAQQYLREYQREALCSSEEDQISYAQLTLALRYSHSSFNHYQQYKKTKTRSEDMIISDFSAQQKRQQEEFTACQKQWREIRQTFYNRSSAENRSHLPSPAFFEPPPAAPPSGDASVKIETVEEFHLPPATSRNSASGGGGCVLM
ncbi:MAG: hypothetical protein K0S27_1121 [Gammaproteobacteria bacterium]|jgi:hypothetical protein|nr:hypothetical protein [Gammaproteobacteria bacterium]